MASDLDALFEDPAERAAYEAFCEVETATGEPFDLGRPVLVCRWRMAHRHVPLLNRHMRALSERRLQGKPLGAGLLSWVKQHVEWSVAEGSYAMPDGVLMLVVDEDGNAAMTVGAYEPLADCSRAALAARAAAARREAAATGVAPELLCSVHDGRMVLCAPEDRSLCGVGTLVEQVARTRGLEVARSGADEQVAAGAFGGHAGADEVAGAIFLVSDEHGVVSASDAAGAPEDAAIVDFLAGGYAKLFS